LRRAGVNLCLGTDSLASVYKRRHETVELNLFDEMRAVAEAEPWLSPRELVRMVTVNGARALGWEGKVGELVPGAWADLITLPFNGPGRGVYRALVEHRGPVAAVMINGRWETDEQAGARS
jgi:imidazolonepropionase-like amidohydrolase